LPKDSMRRTPKTNANGSSWNDSLTRLSKYVELGNTRPLPAIITCAMKFNLFSLEW
jgi:hypothetical protein